MVMRKLSYFCALIWREYLVGTPGVILVSIVRRSCHFKTERGIQVGDPTPETRDYFTYLIGEAMGLIANCDPVRWKRVQREIHIIINAASTYTSSYERKSRVCMVDLRYFYYADDPPMVVRLLAAELIYQATYGCLCSRGVLRTRRNQQHFDRLRSKEAIRFLRQRVGMTTFASEAESSTESPQRQRWKLLSELRDVLASEPAAEALLWKDVVQRLKESGQSDQLLK
jgi:hypothetical protein